MAVRSYQVLPDELCDALVKLFENDVEHHERVDNQSKPTFTQLNLNQHHAKIIPTLVQYALDTIEQYKKDVPSASYLPSSKFFLTLSLGFGEIFLASPPLKNPSPPLQLYKKNITNQSMT